MHLRSSLRRALLLANKTNICPAASISSQNFALGSAIASPLQKVKPEIKTYENNIVTSPYADCAFHDMTLTQKFFESAARWPDKVALVYVIVFIFSRFFFLMLNCYFE